MSEPLHIAVLMGGWSAEREVSLSSGREIADALESLGHRVTRIADLVPTIEAALAEPGPSVIDVPVDYRDNLRRLGGDLLADVLL